MWVPELVKAIQAIPRNDVGSRALNIIVVGIETHICVLQTTLDALREGNRVWIVQDAVSSCNPEERGVALARLRQEGARVTTSESLMYELMGDASDPA